jgi:hypothetical protein
MKMGCLQTCCNDEPIQFIEQTICTEKTTDCGAMFTDPKQSNEIAHQNNPTPIIYMAESPVVGTFNFENMGTCPMVVRIVLATGSFIPIFNLFAGSNVTVTSTNLVKRIEFVCDGDTVNGCSLKLTGNIIHTSPF